MSAILLLASAALASPMETYGTIEPLHQVVHLSLDPDELAYEGTTTLFLGHSKHITETTLHATERMEITDARFVRGSQTVPATIERDGELVTITPAKPIRVRGMLPRPKRAALGEPLFAQTPTVGLALTFSNTVNEAPYGLYRFEHDGQAFLASQFLSLIHI